MRPLVPARTFDLPTSRRTDGPLVFVAAMALRPR